MEIRQSSLEKFFFNKISRILLTLLKFLFFSLAFIVKVKIFFFRNDFLISKIFLLGTFLSIINKQFLTMIELLFRIFDIFLLS